MSLAQWSTTPANNATAGSINWAEGQLPSTVNDSARQMMADVATWYATPEWLDYGYVPTYISATSFSVPGNVTSSFHANRRTKLTDGASTLYGTVASSTYDGTTKTTVTVTLDSGTLDASLSAVQVAALRADYLSVPPLYLPLTGGTITGELDYSAAAGTARLFGIKTAGVTRWNYGAEGSAESGANAGSNFVITRNSDAGATIGTPININRATGVVTLEEVPSFPAAATGDNSNNGANTAFVKTAISNGRVLVPQTVLSGNADSNGYANFLTVGTGLAVNLLATASPLVLSFAGGYSAYGAADYIGQIAADATPAWSGLTASSTLYLYIDRNTSTGALTYGFSALAPIYQDATPASPATDQHWFSPLTMQMLRWNGSAWTVVQRVFVGQCVTGASSVTSAAAYAFKGRYESQQIAIVQSSTASFVHNLGLTPKRIEGFLVCVTSELGYGVGNIIPFTTFDNGNATPTIASDTMNGAFTQTAAGFALATEGTGTRAAITNANWKAKFLIERGW